MKKIILSISILCGLNAYSQNTIPTTTVNGALSVNDELKVTKEIVTLSRMTVHGEVLAKDTVRAKENIIAEKDIKVDRNVYVNQDIMVEGKLTSKGGLTFDGTNGISYTPATATSPKTFRYGNSKINQTLASCSAGPQSWANHQFGGMMQIYDADPLTGTYVANSGLLNFQTWSGGSSIDASIGGQTGAGGLLLNYFCGNDVSICQGSNGGFVGMGKNVEMGFPVRNSQTLLNLALPVGISKAIVINNPAINTTKNVFEVTSEGTTYIGIGRPKAGGIAANAMLSVDGLILAKEVRVAVSTTTHWADYVFEKNYKLKSLTEVENYIKKYKHLPDVPSASDVKENGVDMLEISAILLKKIEELTLYTIELQKKVDAQQKEIDSLVK